MRTRPLLSLLEKYASCFEKTIIIALPGDKKHHAMRIYLEKYISYFLFISVLFLTLMFILFCTLTVNSAGVFFHRDKKACYKDSSGNIVHPLLGSFFFERVSNYINNMFSLFPSFYFFLL